MTPEARRELDKRHSEALSLAMNQTVNPNKTYSAKLFRIAVHVRRGDKVALHEARPVSASRFIAALKTIADQLNPPDNKTSSKGDDGVVYLVHLFTDGAEVLQEFKDALQAPEAAGLFGNSTVHLDFRFAGYRPDKGFDETLVNEAFWQLLVDLKMMVESDAFLGSQSSNVGVTACYLRVHHRCFNVEHRTLSWHPANSKVA